MSKAYKRYVLGILTLVYMLNYLDRNLIILLLEPIKEDLHLSDTQLGLVTGIAFGLFYAVLGLPIARWADRGNRVTITSLAIALWGITVMGCLYVGNFIQLVGARIAAAVGESGCMPPTYSLVGDYFPSPSERPRMMAIYMLALPSASLISFIAGGWLNDLYGWRMTFFLIGIPGLLLAVLVKLTVAEPRTKPGYVNTDPQSFPGMGAVLKVLWQQQSSRHLGIGYILLLTMALGMAPWYAAFLIRSHAMSVSEVGIALGLIFGIGGIAGTLLGGYLASHWYADNERGQMRLSAATIAALLPCFMLFLLPPGKQQSLIGLVPLVVVFNVFLGPTFALMQRLVVADMRARTVAVVMLLANLIGMGAGPLLVGLLSDFLEPRLGADSLRYAMLAMAFVSLWSAYHFWRVGRTVAFDLSASNA
jgi:predicted MFS family arabinose efflux permease